MLDVVDVSKTLLAALLAVLSLRVLRWRQTTRQGLERTRRRSTPSSGSIARAH